jgi:RNA polymerase sigma-70 factor (ECF subfamily)
MIFGDAVTELTRLCDSPATGIAGLCTTLDREGNCGLARQTGGLAPVNPGFLAAFPLSEPSRIPTMPLSLRLDTPRWMPQDAAATNAQDSPLEGFLRGVERRALRMAELSVGNREEGLDLVQDAMLGFVRHYADKPAEDWAPLFFRVLDSRITDWHRRQQVRGRWLSAWFRREDEDDGEDPLAQAPDPHDPGPLARLAGGEAAQALDGALRALPLRQRQAFLLRLWEGLDVADTARAMGCSEGSVKTHLFRALAALRRRLEEHQ